MNWLEIYYTDVYKVGHKVMLPVGSVLMQSNFTPRSGKLSNCPNDGKIVSFGQQMLVRKIKEDWDNNFFKRDIKEIDQFGKDMTAMLMLEQDYDVSHFKALHALQYLPIEIKAIQEGEIIPYKIPLYTIVNTKPINNEVFDWIVNYLETILSAEAWQAPTSATYSHVLRQLGKKWITETDIDNMWFLDYQFHDFSMRGQAGKSAIVNSGLGFATSSKGSDTLPVIPAARKYYDETDVCINSVIASEHAIMCTLTGFFLKTKEGTWENIGELEVETFRYLLKTFPTGILSLVSDTWDLWRVICEYCVILKEEILARDGKLVLRPDSGNPVDIICGKLSNYIDFDNLNEDSDWESFSHFIYENYANSINGKLIQLDGKIYKLGDFKYFIQDYGWENGLSEIIYNIKSLIDNRLLTKVDKPLINITEQKGVIELLWDIFGGTVNKQGYKVLDPHVGCIYGDSINYDRAQQIFGRLAAKGFASTNIVLGIGSYSLQYVTRDTHGFAQKATYVEIMFPKEDSFKKVVKDENGKSIDHEEEMELVGIEIFKDPITDDGVKKSARGLMVVYKDEKNNFILKDRCSWDEVNDEKNELKTIFKDGKFYNQTTLTEIRKKLY